MIGRPTNSDYWEHDPEDEKNLTADPEYGAHWFMKPCENFDDKVAPPNEETEEGST